MQLNPNRWMAPLEPTKQFAGGARLGYQHGKGRAGSYIVGEEELLAWEAADETYNDGETGSWWEFVKGYEYGYQRAAEGGELERELIEEDR